MGDTFNGEVPRDILDRLARRVDEDRFYTRDGIRTHAIATSAPPALGYRASPKRETLHVVATQSTSLEDVRFDLDGRRLRWEVRFPKERRLAACLWWGFVSLPFVIAFGVVAVIAPSEMPWSGLVVAFVVSTILAWAFTAWFIHDTRKSVRADMQRIITETISE